MNNVQHVFLIGAKSLGAYGGYETFIDKLTEYHQNDPRIVYHVACKANGNGSMNPYKTPDATIINEKEFIYHNAQCFRIDIPEKLGPVQAIYYDCKAIEKSLSIIKEKKIKKPIIYIMACRIGPFIKYYYEKIKKVDGTLYINPDGHEWLRDKWILPVKAYWKYSEKRMVKYSDLVVCDSLAIEKYIHNTYDNKFQNKKTNTVYIAYGAETRKSKLNDNSEIYLKWMDKNKVKPFEYYLVVGRFVPENNYEIMIKEFMRSKTKKKFVIITNVNAKYLKQLENRLHFMKDSRIKFVGTVYNKELLMKIREHAFAYLHGHEVGGTNPSLLEAMSSTKINLLLDVEFNKEVGRDAAIYWTKSANSLSKIINTIEKMDENEIENFGIKAKKRIQDNYNWNIISNKYIQIFNQREELYENIDGK